VVGRSLFIGRSSSEIHLTQPWSRPRVPIWAEKICRKTVSVRDATLIGKQRFGIGDTSRTFRSKKKAATKELLLFC
jgi:hypothetical protein